jgi:hypothetical protein
MLIGKCFGMGGASDYFKGLIDEVRVYNRPLSQQEVYKLYMRDANGRSENTEGFGSFNIKPTIMPRAGRIFADLDYRGLVPTPKNLRITADLLDDKDVVIARGKIRMLPAWGRAEAVFDIAKLPAGKYIIRANATKGKTASLTVNWPGRAKGWENVKVLNNFCWELLNVSPAEKAKTEYVFTNPRRSWVYFEIDVEGGMTLSVSGANPEVLHADDSIAKREVMRWLEPGEYRITLGSEGALKKLVVRSVPILAFHHYPHVGPGTGEDQEFINKHVIGSYNTMVTHDYQDATNGQFRKKWSGEMGRHVVDTIYPATHLEWSKLLKDDTARQQIWDYVAPSAGMDLSKSEYFGVVMDEFTAGNDRIMWVNSRYDEWTETLAKMMEDPKYAGRYVMAFFGYNMYDFEKSKNFLRMFIEHGAPMYEEWYLAERDTEEQAWIYINESGAAVEHRWKQELPGFTELAVKFVSYLQREIWNPGVNFKTHMEMQFEHYATRPEFFGVGGMGAWSSYNCNSGEYVRWVAELGRHYGLEGNTQRLSTDPYESVQISNPDFIDGSNHWTLRPAKKKSMLVKSHKGYGAMQERVVYRAWMDTHFLWTKRSAEKPNVFSQEIGNLEAGRLYSVRVWIADYTELMAAELNGKKRAVNLSVDGGEVWDDWYRTKSFTAQSEKSNFFIQQTMLRLCHVQQLIFRATGPTATLSISDWKTKSEPGGPIGQELMFNNIDVHPYFEPLVAPIGVNPEKQNKPAAQDASKKTMIFLCAGQSNMVGGIKAKDLTGVYAKSPANAIYWSWAKSSWIDFPDNTSDHTRIGPEISFAHKMAKAFPNDTIAIVKLSVGGMTLDGQWKPGSGDLYKRLIKNTKAAIESIESRGDTCEVAGMLWMQGESDAIEDERHAAEAYEVNLNKLIELIRKDLQVPTLDVVIGRISDELAKATQLKFTNLKTVQQAQDQVARNDANVHLIKVDDLHNDTDHIHYLPEGYFTMGNRFAQAMINARSGQRGK